MLARMNHTVNDKVPFSYSRSCPQESVFQNPSSRLTMLATKSKLAE